MLPLEESTFASRLRAVEARIESALQRAHRQRSEITLVAVTKKFSADRIRLAYEAGLRDFGENYVQEFAEKAPQLSGLEGARFHLIGQYRDLLVGAIQTREGSLDLVVGEAVRTPADRVVGASKNTPLHELRNHVNPCASGLPGTT